MRTSVSAAIFTTDKFVFVENLKLHADMELSAMTSAFTRIVSMSKVEEEFKEFFEEARFTYSKKRVTIINSEREKELMEQAFVSGWYRGKDAQRRGSDRP